MIFSNQPEAHKNKNGDVLRPLANLDPELRLTCWAVGSSASRA